MMSYCLEPWYLDLIITLIQIGLAFYMGFRIGKINKQTKNQNLGDKEGK